MSAPSRSPKFRRFRPRTAARCAHRHDGTDRGVTLVELLISTSIVGVIVVSIAAAMIVVLKLQKPTGDRIAESKDITFVQNYVPQDLSNAVTSDRSPTYQVTGSTLPGTNVLTLRRPDLVNGGYYWVAYRYLQVGTEWHLRRYELTGTAPFTIREVGVAYRLEAPPEGWTPDQSPVHAIEVTARNQVILRPIGEDLTFTFESGQQFTTGGAGLSSEDRLPTDYSGGFVDPSAPPSRCGGTVTLVLDTSTSIPNQNGESAMMTASKGFIDAFAGTPTYLNVVGFDQKAYALYPTSAGPLTAGAYVNLLTDSAGIAAAKQKIDQLQDLPGGWSWSNKDPGGDGFYWGFGWTNSSGPGGTNWEDGLWLPFRNSSGTAYSQLPDLVVFITDGQPNRRRSGNTSTSSAVTSASSAANFGRGTGARIVGILVGSEASSSKNNLNSVVGNNEWNGTGPSNPGNAAAADVFMPGNNGDFSQLGNTLRAIMVAQCGGTVTVQKRIETSPGVLVDATTPWTYTTDVGVRDLNPANESSVTFDYTFGVGVTERTTQITETPQEGYVFDRAECSVGGVPVDPSRVGYPTDGTPAVNVTIKPDEAMSCIMISTPV